MDGGEHPIQGIQKGPGLWIAARSRRHWQDYASLLWYPVPASPLQPHQAHEVGLNPVQVALTLRRKRLERLAEAGPNKAPVASRKRKGKVAEVALIKVPVAPKKSLGKAAEVAPKKAPVASKRSQRRASKSGNG